MTKTPIFSNFKGFGKMKRVNTYLEHLRALQLFDFKGINSIKILI